MKRGIFRFPPGNALQPASPKTFSIRIALTFFYCFSGDEDAMGFSFENSIRLCFLGHWFQPMGINFLSSGRSVSASLLQ